MRSILHTLALTFFAGALSAQHFCRTTEAQNEWFIQHPELRAAFEQRRHALAEQDRAESASGAQGRSAAAAGNYTIPVVFHILHLGGTENVSDAQVTDAVNILTRDFNKMNADTNDVVQPFKSLVGNARIEFRLATKDPNGNCTNGIIRHWDANTNWTNDFADYIYSWPHNRYLNIYVVKTMGSGAAGYTYLPGSGVPNSADAIVILSGYVGSIGTGNTGTSRALTHEVGHWLDLEHTWGYNNTPGTACGDDGITDTPVTKGFSSCNLSNASICNPPIVENMQNYMDYAYCQRMFTLRQCMRMTSAITSPVEGRNNLSAPANLAGTGITTTGSNCMPMLDITVLPSATVCTGKPLSLKSFTSNAPPISYSWSATNGASLQSASAPTTTITFNTPGLATVNCVVAGPTGNVSKSLVVFVKNGITDYSGNYSESFETASLPAPWTPVNNASPGMEWKLYNGAGSLGSQCVYVAGETLPANTVETLEGPSYDFKNNPGSIYTFKYAYARYSSANKDVFKVQATKDCGGTWQDIWAPSTSALASPSGGTNQLLLVPFDEWELYTLSSHPAFIPFLSEDNVKIRFYFQEDPGGSGYGNRIYLDEINFSIPNGVNEMTRAVEFNVYPNPSSAAATISFNLSDAAKMRYSVVSVTGSIVESRAEQSFGAGPHLVSVNSTGSYAPGIYFVNVELNGVKMSRKLIIN